MLKDRSHCEESNEGSLVPTTACEKVFLHITRMCVHRGAKTFVMGVYNEYNDLGGHIYLAKLTNVTGGKLIDVRGIHQTKSGARRISAV